MIKHLSIGVHRWFDRTASARPPWSGHGDTSPLLGAWTEPVSGLPPLLNRGISASNRFPLLIHPKLQRHHALLTGVTIVSRFSDS